MQHEMSPRSTSHTPANVFTSMPYSSIFFHNDLSAASPPNYNSSPMATDEQTSRATVTAAAAVSSLTRLMSLHKELLNRHTFCVSQLHKTLKEAETLCQENTNLRVANCQLSEQLNFLLQAASLQSHLQNAAALSESSNGFEGKDTEVETDNMMESPTSVMQNETSNEIQNAADPGRVTLPKSISVRSNGYLKISPNSGGAGSSANANVSGLDAKPKRGSSKIRSPSIGSGTKKVYVRGKKDGIELEVYNQGMIKTELCNKWQETGNCPYGDHCQFAHGIQELRPVIRHPRYKTEVCRMVLAGDPCPYGHRCHFRHALTDQEKLMLPLYLE